MKFLITLYFDSCRRYEARITATCAESAVTTAITDSMAYNQACLLNGAGGLRNENLQKIEIEEI